MRPLGGCDWMCYTFHHGKLFAAVPFLKGRADQDTTTRNCGRRIQCDPGRSERVRVVSSWTASMAVLVTYSPFSCHISVSWPPSAGTCGRIEECAKHFGAIRAVHPVSSLRTFYHPDGALLAGPVHGAALARGLRAGEPRGDPRAAAAPVPRRAVDGARGTCRCIV